MATEAVRVDSYWRAPTLHYVTSADDVIHCGSQRPTVVVGRGPWTSQRDAGPRQRPTPPYGQVRAGEVSACRRKLSVDDSPSCRRGAAAAVNGSSRRRPIAGSSSDDWMSDGRRLSAWSPPRWSTLSRTLSEHTLDRGSQYRAAQCRDDVLDDFADEFLSPPRIAPVSGQLSLVSIRVLHLFLVGLKIGVGRILDLPYGAIWRCSRVRL